MYILRACMMSWRQWGCKHKQPRSLASAPHLSTSPNILRLLLCPLLWGFCTQNHSELFSYFPSQLERLVLQCRYPTILFFGSHMSSAVLSSWSIHDQWMAALWHWPWRLQQGCNGLQFLEGKPNAYSPWVEIIRSSCFIGGKCLQVWVIKKLNIN